MNRLLDLVDRLCRVLAWLSLVVMGLFYLFGTWCLFRNAVKWIMGAE